jgi:FMN reductase
LDRLATADAAVAGTLVFEAGVTTCSGRPSSCSDNDLMVAKRVLPAGAGRNRRDVVVIEHQMRRGAPGRAVTGPTSAPAALTDWGATERGERRGGAATQLSVMVHAGVEGHTANYPLVELAAPIRRQATRAERTADPVDFDSQQMRLAATGRPAPRGMTPAVTAVPRTLRPLPQGTRRFAPGLRANRAGSTIAAAPRRHKLRTASRSGRSFVSR